MSTKFHVFAELKCVHISREYLVINLRGNKFFLRLFPSIGPALVVLAVEGTIHFKFSGQECLEEPRRWSHGVQSALLVVRLVEGDGFPVRSGFHSRQGELEVPGLDGLDVEVLMQGSEPGLLANCRNLQEQGFQLKRDEREERRKWFEGQTRTFQETRVWFDGTDLCA